MPKPQVELDQPMIKIGHAVASLQKGCIEGGMTRSEATRVCEAYMHASVTTAMTNVQIAGSPLNIDFEGIFGKIRKD